MAVVPAARRLRAGLIVALALALPLSAFSGFAPALDPAPGSEPHPQLQAFLVEGVSASLEKPRNGFGESLFGFLKHGRRAAGANPHAASRGFAFQPGAIAGARQAERLSSGPSRAPPASLSH